MVFIGIWYDMNSEVKRDRVIADDVNEASNLLYAKYTTPPAPCLSVVPENGEYSAENTAAMGGTSTW